MKTRSFYPVLLALFAIGSVLSQNAEELPIPVETDNQFPPEHSEMDSYNENSASTAAEPPQSTLGLTTNVPASTLAEENEQAIDEGSGITAAKSTQTTLGSTITEVATESFETTSESTIADKSGLATAKDDEQDTKIEDNETTAAEPTQTTSESTLVEVGVLDLSKDDKQVTKNENSETTPAEPTQTSESTLKDIAAPTLTTKYEQDTIYGGSETTAAQLSEISSESTTVDVGEPMLANDDDHVTINEGTETMTEETTPTMSRSTISNDQVTNNEGTDITVVETTESTPDFPNIVVDSSKLIDAESPCPQPCICITEGDSSNYIVDCSGHGLTDWPAPIDPKTTTLKLQNNRLTVIPKGISELKNLKNLNANDNLISEVESGSISELSELVSLKLANNRFLEYPKDLENASNLVTLEEVDLAGNELKTTPDIFLNLKALRTVTLPEVSSELVSQLCSLQETLVTVCTKSCSEHSFECKDVSVQNKDNSVDATLPGMIPFLSDIAKDDTENQDDIHANSENFDTPQTVNPEAPEIPPRSAAKETLDIMPLPEVPFTPTAKENSDTHPDLSASEISSNSKRKESSEISPKAPETPSAIKDNLPVNDFSLRTAVNNAPQEKVALQSIIIDNSKESPHNETDVKVGAKTTETKGGGGVDKSVIAVIVAGMIIIVAIITIKKNWNSITKRFSSTPRANDRSDRNTNGTTVTPEEVPLQEKSPV